MSRLSTSLAALAAGAVVAVGVPFFDGALERTAAACSCAPPVPPQAERDAAVAVFSGTITSVRSAGVRREVTFTVDRVYKGNVPATVTAGTAPVSMCGIDVTVGARWLVYSMTTPFTLSSCSRTRRMEDTANVKDDLAVLGAGHEPAGAAPSPSAAPSATTTQPTEAPKKRGCGGCTTSREAAPPMALWLGVGLLLARRARRLPNAR